MKVTDAELERLSILAEECSEVIQIVNKIIRHGYESYHPEDKDKTPNREHLERELGDLAFMVNFCAVNDDINQLSTARHRENKGKTIQQYLHYNTIDLDGE